MEAPQVERERRERQDKLIAALLELGAWLYGPEVSAFMDREVTR